MGQDHWKWLENDDHALPEFIVIVSNNINLSKHVFL